jgi:hypothetical protein
VDPVQGPLLRRKSGSAGNRTRDLCVSSRELCRPQRRSLITFQKYILVLYVPVDTYCTEASVCQNLTTTTRSEDFFIYFGFCLRRINTDVEHVVRNSPAAKDSVWLCDLCDGGDHGSGSITYLSLR